MIDAELFRRAMPSDAAALAAIYDPIVANTIISFEETAPGPDGIRHRIEAAGDSYPWLVCERAGQVVGYVYASPHRTRAAYRWGVDVSAYVAPSAQRSGIARRLYLRLFEILGAQGYCVACAGIALPNEPSCKLHESVGFTKVGVYHGVGFKLGAWHDVGWYERRLRPADEAPPKLRLLSEL
jgi:phosphinothricin acetyltransferase